MKKFIPLIPYYISSFFISVLIIITPHLIHIKARMDYGGPITLWLVVGLCILFALNPIFNLFALRKMSLKQKFIWICFEAICCIFTGFGASFLFEITQTNTIWEILTLAFVYMPLALPPIIIGGGVSLIQSLLLKARNTISVPFKVNVLFQVVVFISWFFLLRSFFHLASITVALLIYFEALLFPYPLLLILAHYLNNDIRKGMPALIKTGALFSALNMTAFALYPLLTYFCKLLELPYYEEMHMYFGNFLPLHITLCLCEIAVFWIISLLSYWLTHLYDKKRQSLHPVEEISE